MKTKFKMKSLTIILAIVTILFAMVAPVFAAETNYSVGMSLASSSKLKEGDTVTVKVNLTSINAGEGIDTITAQLNYDEDVFEALTSSNMTAGADWTPSFANSTKMLTLQKNSKVKAAETVLTITLKVKAAINVDSTTITLKDIVASGGRVVDGGTGDITVNNASVTISKEKVPQATTNTTVKDNTISKKPTLPKTGIEQYGIIAIAVIAIIAVFSYAVYKKIAKEVK